MKPWIVLTGICLILDIINNIRLLASGYVPSNHLPVWMLFNYFFLVVLSFKKEIQEEAGTGEDGHGKVQNNPDNLMMII